MSKGLNKITYMVAGKHEPTYLRKTLEFVFRASGIDIRLITPKHVANGVQKIQRQGKVTKPRPAGKAGSL